MYNRYDEAREIEKKIVDLKDNDMDKLIRPVDAFITFEEEDGKIVADSYEHDPKHETFFLGKRLEFIEATEPTNIIWENRHNDAIHYLK